MKSSGLLLGVDLGTTWTAAAVDGEVLTLANHGAAMPSVVALDGDRIVVGEAAERRLLADPTCGVREMKRRLGDTTPMVLGGTPFGAEALMGHLLAHVVAVATERHGAAPAQVVLTHPANWGQYKLDLLREAARLAGVVQVALRSEPEAAALHYVSLGRLHEGDTVAVYDFGGGTFDAAVVRCTAGGAELLGQAEGLERLGGIDIDQVIVAHVHEALDGQLAELDGSDPEVRRALARLRADCTTAKEALSSDGEVAISVMVPGLSTTVRLTRTELESALRPRLADTVASLERAVRSAGVTPEQLAGVVLVGGSSRIPLVAEEVARHFGRPVLVDADPKLVVCMGATPHDPIVPSGNEAVPTAAVPEATPRGGAPDAAPTPGAAAPAAGAAPAASRIAANTAQAAQAKKERSSMAGTVAAGVAAVAGVAAAGMAVTGKLDDAWDGVFGGDDDSMDAFDTAEAAPQGLMGAVPDSVVADAEAADLAEAGEPSPEAVAAALAGMAEAATAAQAAQAAQGGADVAQFRQAAPRPQAQHQAAQHETSQSRPSASEQPRPQAPSDATTGSSDMGSGRLDDVKQTLTERLSTWTPPEGADPEEAAQLRAELAQLIERHQVVPGQSVEQAIDALQDEFGQRVQDFVQDTKIDALIADQQEGDAPTDATATDATATDATTTDDGTATEGTEGEVPTGDDSTTGTTDADAGADAGTQPATPTDGAPVTDPPGPASDEDPEMATEVVPGDDAVVKPAAGIELVDEFDAMMAADAAPASPGAAPATTGAAEVPDAPVAGFAIGERDPSAPVTLTDEFDDVVGDQSWDEELEGTELADLPVADETDQPDPRVTMPAFGDDLDLGDDEFAAPADAAVDIDLPEVEAPELDDTWSPDDDAVEDFEPLDDPTAP